MSFLVAQGLVLNSKQGMGLCPVLHKLIWRKKTGLNSSSQNNHHHHGSSQEVERFSLEEEVMRQKEQQQKENNDSFEAFQEKWANKWQDFRNEAEPKPEIKAGLIQGLWQQKPWSTHYWLVMHLWPLRAEKSLMENWKLPRAVKQGWTTQCPVMSAIFVI